MRPLPVILVAFVASRVIYRAAFGLELDASPVYYFLQFLDPFFLESDLGRSVLSLHHQAPLLNLLVGACLHLFGRGAFIAVDVVFVALGLAAALSLGQALVDLEQSPRAAAISGSLWACAPVTVLYESWLFYPHVVVSLLLVAAWLLLRFLKQQTVWSGVAFFGVLALVGLVRSTYGPLWLSTVAGVLLLCRPLPRATIAKAAAAPLLLLLVHSAKTPLYTGHGYGDAMLWPNVAKKVYMSLPRREQKRLVREGHVSPAMKHEAFSDLATMTEVRVPHDPTGIPALDLERAPSGRLNANAIEHVLIAERYYKPDALFLLKHYPGTYAKASLAAFFGGVPGSPTDDTSLIRSANYARLRGVDALLKKVALTTNSGFSPVVALLLVIAIGGGIAGLVRGGARRAFSAFALSTILYTTAVTAMISWGDFPRYRFETDGLSWILGTLAITGVKQQRNRARSRRAVDPALARLDANGFTVQPTGARRPHLSRPRSTGDTPREIRGRKTSPIR